MSTVRDVYLRYPERVEELFQSIDVEHKGLVQVKTALAAGDYVKASEALLDYYRHGNTGTHLRQTQPAPSDARKPLADSILQDLFRFYDLSDRVPRKENGQLDWSHDGPDGDIEWAWGLNRHGHLSILLEAYLETGNADYARTIDAHVQDWVASSLPYPAVKSSTPMWRGLEVALRAKVWVRLFYALISSDLFSPAAKLMMLTSIPDHTHYMRNFHAPAGNWLTMEMSGLAMVATAWPEFRQSSEFVAYAKERMLEGLLDQVYPDGVQKELTSHYHYVALYNFRHFAEICKYANEPLPEEYHDTLEKLEHYLAYTMAPTGFGILNNDSDHRYNRDHILEAADAYNRTDWRFIASNGRRGTRPEDGPSVLFPWAGQLIMRSGYEADAHWAFFDIGPWGTGHQHSDKLHLSVTAFGRDLLVDGGRFAYRGTLARKFRRYATGSDSHNLILIDGEGQSPGPRVADHPIAQQDYRLTERFDYARGAFDQFGNLEGSVRHTRAVFYVRGQFWVVADRIETDRPRTVQALWHWHPDSKVEARENGVVSTDHQKGNLTIIPVGTDDWEVEMVKGAENPPQGWYSERYNHAVPAPVSIYNTDIKEKTTFVWILYPSEGKAGAVTAQLLAANDELVSVQVKDESGNRWDVTVPFESNERAGYSYRSGLEDRIRGTQLHDVRGAERLLARLDLNRPGLESVREASANTGVAIRELLTYFRNRKDVVHPVDRGKREQLRGQAANESDMKQADEALQHVFVGQRAYPSYYCGDDINWGLRPVPDNEWVWQLNRMSFWDALGRAYWHTGDEKYAREWALQLVDWTIKNPRDEAHRHAWRSIEAGIRGYRWTGLFQRFIDSPAFTPEVLVAFLNSCYEHASYLMTSYRKGSNWGLMEAEGMAFIATIFPEFRDAIKWRTEAVTRLNAEIDNQVYPDGHQRELAMGYHTGSIGWFKRTLDLLTMNGLADVFPPRYKAMIEKMCEVPFKLGMPDGATTQFGDSWKGSPGHIWPNLREWADLFDRDDFLYVATGGREGRKPDATAFALETSGLYSMRSGWHKEAICLVLKCGPNGGAHCQPDNGTFELYAGGRHLMPDAGSYIYSGDPEGRAWFRQTSVHQTLTLNGENSAYAPRHLLWKPGKRDDILVVENGSYEGLTHRRAVIFVDKKYFVIVDEAIGATTGDVDIHFQLAPGDAVFDSTNFSVRSNFSEGWNVHVRTNPQHGLTMAEEEGWVSFEYTKKEPRPAFRYRIRKPSQDGVRFVTVVVPYEGAVPPDIKVDLPGNPAIGSSRMALKVSSPEGTRRITYMLSEK